MKKLTPFLLSLSLICIPAHAFMWEIFCGAASAVVGVDIYVPQEYFTPKPTVEPAVTIPAEQEEVDAELFKGIKANDIEKIKLLIEQGTDVNSRCMAKNNDFYVTPLMWAIEYGSTKVYEQLEMIPPINVTYMEEIVRILLDAGAHVQISNHMQETALIVAAKKSPQVPPRVFELLINAHSKLIPQDDSWWSTLYYYAEKNEDKRLIGFLQKKYENRFWKINS
jgi:ankyrin repeat protein